MSLLPRQVQRVIARLLSTSTHAPARFRPTPPPSSLKDIGRLLPARFGESYEPGQMFIHRVFAYKGVIVCGFDSRVHEKRVAGADGDRDKPGSFYQVLIDRDDWPVMGFPVDLTYYLGEQSSRGERLVTSISGMDCVSHQDILPFATTEPVGVQHDLFDRIFAIREQPRMMAAEPHTYTYEMRPELKHNYLTSQQTWLAPRDVYKETTDGVEVTVTTFFLGSTVVAGATKYCWRYVIRVENTTDSPVVLRERAIKVFSLNNMHQLNGSGVVGTQPELSPSRPAFQFSSTVELPQPKGGHMWGKFKMEREDRSLFDVTIPTIVLESTAERPAQADMAGE